MGGSTRAIRIEANQLRNDCNHIFSLNVAITFLSKVVSINGTGRTGGRTAFKRLYKLNAPYLFDSQCVLESITIMANIQSPEFWALVLPIRV